MERGGIRALIMDAIVAATERSAELGRAAGD
jgi:pyrroline-5-carboxylate reductase